MTLTIVLGVVGLHRNVSLVSAVLLVVHVVSAVADGYVQIGCARRRRWWPTWPPSRPGSAARA